MLVTLVGFRIQAQTLLHLTPEKASTYYHEKLNKREELGGLSSNVGIWFLNGYHTYNNELVCAEQISTPRRASLLAGTPRTPRTPGRKTSPPSKPSTPRENTFPTTNDASPDRSLTPRVTSPNTLDVNPDSESPDAAIAALSKYGSPCIYTLYLSHERDPDYDQILS